MGRPFWSIGIVIALAAGLAVDAPAGIIWNSGVLHASASATNASGTVSSNPPDVVMSSNTASHSATATNPTNASASASTSVTIGPGSGLSLSANSDFGFLSGQSSASAAVSGSSAFTESTTETLTASFTASAVRGSGSVTIKDAANNTIATYLSSSPGSGPAQIAFTPGAYTISWNWATQPFVGTGGSSGMNFSLALVPEPASLSLLGLSAVAFARLSRRT